MLAGGFWKLFKKDNFCRCWWKVGTLREKRESWPWYFRAHFWWETYMELLLWRLYFSGEGVTFNFLSMASLLDSITCHFIVKKSQSKRNSVTWKEKKGCTPNLSSSMILCFSIPTFATECSKIHSFPALQSVVKVSVKNFKYSDYYETLDVLGRYQSFS